MRLKAGRRGTSGPRLKSCRLSAPCDAPVRTRRICLFLGLGACARESLRCSVSQCASCVSPFSSHFPPTGSLLSSTSGSGSLFPRTQVANKAGLAACTRPWPRQKKSPDVKANSAICACSWWASDRSASPSRSPTCSLRGLQACATSPPQFWSLAESLRCGLKAHVHTAGRVLCSSSSLLLGCSWSPRAWPWPSSAGNRPGILHEAQSWVLP